MRWATVVNFAASSMPFQLVVSDDYVEDIEISLLSDPDLLIREPHDIVKALADQDGNVADVIRAALDNGTEIYVNDMPNMDHAAYRFTGGDNFPTS